MSFWRRLFSLKDNPVHRQITLWRGSQAVWSEDDFETYAREGYTTNLYAYRATKLVAQSVGALKWMVFQNRNGKRIEIEDPNHPVKKLLKRPNPEFGGTAFFQSMEIYKIISGNVFILAAGPSGSEKSPVREPKELWLLRPDRTKPVSGTAAQRILGYDYVLNNTQRFHPSVICHIREFHPVNDFYGLPIFKPGARSIDIDNDGRKWNKALLQNSANPSLMLATELELNDPTFDRLIKQFGDGWSGIANAGKVKVLEGGLKPEKVSWSPRDMEWSTQSIRSAKEISITIGVAPELIGDSANKTYSNYKEARKALYEDTVFPHADLNRDEINHWFAQWFPDIEIDYDRDDVEAVREDRQQWWTSLDQAFEKGTITRDENREGKGYEPLGNDFMIIPLGGTPVAVGDDVVSAMEPPEIPEDVEKEEDIPEDKSRFELKSLNINTPSKRFIFEKSVNRRRDRWIKSINLAAKKRLDQQAKSIVAAVRSASDGDSALARAEEAINRQKPLWERFFKSVYMTVGKDFAEATKRGFKSDIFDMPMRPGSDLEKKAVLFAKAATDPWMKSVEEWLKENGGDKIDGITKTDLKRIKRELIEGIQAGEGPGTLADRIENFLEASYKNRALAIARTEVIPASNLASQSVARSTGLPLTKEWLNTGDDRTRDDHLDAGGQVVPIDSAYEVGGEKMMFPGDTSLGASAENTIQCRCSEVYQVVEA